MTSFHDFAPKPSLSGPAPLHREVGVPTTFETWEGLEIWKDKLYALQFLRLGKKAQIWLILGKLWEVQMALWLWRWNNIR